MSDQSPLRHLFAPWHLNQSVTVSFNDAGAKAIYNSLTDVTATTDQTKLGLVSTKEGKGILCRKHSNNSKPLLQYDCSIFIQSNGEVWGSNE